eukprot:scaffold659236_cov67-Attheya_sp.AAC.1
MTSFNEYAFETVERYRENLYTFPFLQTSAVSFHGYIERSDTSGDDSCVGIRFIGLADGELDPTLKSNQPLCCDGVATAPSQGTSLISQRIAK